MTGSCATRDLQIMTLHVSSEKTWKASKSVQFSMEPEASRWPEICLYGIKSSRKPILTVWLLAVRSH